MKRNPVTILQEAGRHHGCSGRVGKILLRPLPPPGLDPRTVKPIGKNKSCKMFIYIDLQASSHFVTHRVIRELGTLE
jgi:hypothetical protein